MLMSPESIGLLVAVEAQREAPGLSVKQCVVSQS